MANIPAIHQPEKHWRGPDWALLALLTLVAKMVNQARCTHILRVMISTWIPRRVKKCTSCLLNYIVVGLEPRIRLSTSFRPTNPPKLEGASWPGAAVGRCEYHYNLLRFVAGWSAATNTRSPPATPPQLPKQPGDVALEDTQQGWVWRLMDQVDCEGADHEHFH